MNSLKLGHTCICPSLIHILLVFNVTLHSLQPAFLLAPKKIKNAFVRFQELYQTLQQVNHNLQDPFQLNFNHFIDMLFFLQNLSNIIYPLDQTMFPSACVYVC